MNQSSHPTPRAVAAEGGMDASKCNSPVMRPKHWELSVYLEVVRPVPFISQEPKESSSFIQG